MSELSPEQEPRLEIPDDIYFITDPNTGDGDATLELWNLGPHSDGVQQAIDTYLESTGGSFDTPLRNGRGGMSAPSVGIAFSVIPNLIKLSPKTAQFFAVGREEACALAVSYVNPFDTKPKEHPQINEIVISHVGPYFAFRKVQFRRP